MCYVKLAIMQKTYRAPSEKLIGFLTSQEGGHLKQTSARTLQDES